MGIGAVAYLYLAFLALDFFQTWKEWPPHKVGIGQFLGYDCVERTCLGHRRGFLWAMNKGLTDQYDCEDANSNAFIEGCKAYVAQQDRFAPFSQDEVIAALVE